jgi:Transposase DDE domain group 1
VGNAESGPIRLSFNPQLRVEFRGASVTSDAGLLLPRELDERLGVSTMIERQLSDPRTGRNAQFPLGDLFRQSIYSRLARYEDTNDAERLAEDPTFRMLASRARRETSVALTSTLHWFETDALAEERNYQGLARLNTALMQHASTRSPSQQVVLDIDSSESPVHGTQEQSAYNGTSSPSAITRSSSSIPRATASRRSYGPGTSTVRRAGTRSCCSSLIDTTGAGTPWWSRRTLRSPCRRSTRRWNAVVCATRSGCQRMM